MIITIKGNSYEMGRKEFKGLIAKISKSIPDKPTIIALEKDGYAEMRNDVFQTQKDLTNAVTEWNKEGFKVRYKRGI